MSVENKEKHTTEWSHQRDRVLNTDGQVLVKTGRDVNQQDEIDLALIVASGGLLRTARLLADYSESKDKIDLHLAMNEAEKALSRYDGLVSEIKHDHEVIA